GSSPAGGSSWARSSPAASAASASTAARTCASTTCSTATTRSRGPTPSWPPCPRSRSRTSSPSHPTCPRSWPRWSTRSPAPSTASRSWRSAWATPCSSWGRARTRAGRRGGPTTGGRPRCSSATSAAGASTWPWPRSAGSWATPGWPARTTAWRRGRPRPGGPGRRRPPPQAGPPGGPGGGAHAGPGRLLRRPAQARPGEPARHEPAPLQGAGHPRGLRGHHPPVPDHHGVPEPAAEGARPGRDPPVPPGADRRGVRDHPVGDRAEDGGGPVIGPYVIGCDVGSQGTNAALYAADGRLVASAYEPYDVAYPPPPGAEQAPRLGPAALGAAIPRLLAEVPEGPSAVKGLSFGSQLDGMVVCDAAGAPLRPAMIWMARRAEPQAAAVAAKLSPADFYHH